MIYVDPDYGPSAVEILDAVRAADGSPGRLVNYLSRADSDISSGVVVHETTVPYVAEGSSAVTTVAVAPVVEPALPARSRMATVLWRAGGRAAALHARGRHAAASRLLSRAARVLEARGELVEAARCCLQLGWAARSRGALAFAHESARRAAAIDPSAESQILAGLLDAVSWTDDRRFADAEAALRGLGVACSTLGSGTLEQSCGVALARTLLWQSRWSEAADTLSHLTDPASRSPAPAVLLLRSRLLRESGDIAGALRAARDALGQVRPSGEERLLACAHRAVAEALSVAGEVEQVRLHVGHGLAAAGAARLPLVIVRLRAVMLSALCSASRCTPEETRLRLVLERAIGRRLPALIEHQVRTALDSRRSPPLAWAAANPAPLPFEDFLELAQRANDDQAALEAVMGALCARIGANAAVIHLVDGRAIAASGRPWREPPAAISQALTSGLRVLFDARHQPPEAAEPIRCGGEFLGAIGCRWVAGAVAMPPFVADSLRAAALSIATHVRALVDIAPAPPPAVWGDLLGESAAANALRESVSRAARAPFPVLVEGESGSGKELVARAIHKLSPRHARRFCAINCAALGDDLVEAELFGHARGAFTGAATERAGLFEEADGGTLFLDEVGELSARAQAKLLRVLQEGEVRRVGENLSRRVDVRIVAATNRRLEREAAEGRFRVDLRFRLDVLRITVPALRERLGDVPLLAQHFWQAAAGRVGCRATLGPDAIAALSRHDWPGNVRELQNAIAWMAVHAPRRGRVSASLLPAHLAAVASATGSSFEAAREEFERRFVRAALAQAGGQRQVAAKALGVSRQGLAKMMRRLRIEPSQVDETKARR
jgi:DNA-binding NtrC family response regulator/tetratricopeptide (TPR) repeat protein